MGTFQGLSDLLNEVLEKEKIAGMAVAVTDREKTVFSQGFGVENIEYPERRVLSDSLFRIASITKIFTGICVMNLVEEGKLSLDLPVSATLPELKLQGGAENSITLRNLLSHTAAFPAEYTPDGPREEKDLEKTLLSQLPTVELIGTPGEQFLYSNWGIRLASLMAEKVTAKPFSQLVSEYVLEPMGATRTTFDLHVAATHPMCLAHTEKDGEFQVFHRIQENATRYAAGGLFSNVTDLCRLARVLLNEGVADSGKRVLAKASLDEMKKHHATPKNYDGYGLTLVQKKYQGRVLYGHRGSAPPYSTSLMFDPISGYGIAVLMNTQRDHLRFDLPEKILDYIL